MNLPARKRHGVVYTPAPIVELILDNVLPAGGDELAAASVCDPACGDGAFLTAVASRMLARLSRSDALAALRRLAGYDIDRAAIIRCRAQLDGVLGSRYPDAGVDWNLQERNAFDRAAFRDDNGRFTHIVGNPPYVRVQHLEQVGRRRIAGQWSVIRGATDLYLIFYELGLDLLGSGGVLGYIAPSSWLRSQSGAPLRRLLSGTHRVRRIIDFSEHQVFDNVTTYTAITVIQKDGTPSDIPVSRYDGARFSDAGVIALPTAGASSPWVAATDGERRRMQQLAARGPRLKDIADIHVGIQTLADSVFIRPVAGADSGYLYCPSENGTMGLERWIMRDVVKASVMRDGHDPVRRAVIFPYDRRGRLLPEDYLAANAPAAYRWLSDNKARLLGRDKGQFSPLRWYAFGRHVSITSGFGDKILTSGMNRRPNFQPCPDPAATFYSGYCIKAKPGVDQARLLDALNSDDMEFFIRQTSRPYQGGWMSYAKSFIKDYPVPPNALL